MWCGRTTQLERRYHYRVWSQWRHTNWSVHLLKVPAQHETCLSTSVESHDNTSEIDDTENDTGHTEKIASNTPANHSQISITVSFSTSSVSLSSVNNVSSESTSYLEDPHQTKFSNFRANTINVEPTSTKVLETLV
ncbi:uncharacterized protein LOC143248285 [Tachypleus tridentatus]|uniref:uncharacterized protein LOC143248285 n=1 Tax=Tachypleus tridentatus TaxID=6853 RepID=UPI003FD0035F